MKRTTRLLPGGLELLREHDRILSRALRIADAHRLTDAQLHAVDRNLMRASKALHAALSTKIRKS